MILTEVRNDIFIVTKVDDSSTTSEAQALGPEISTRSSPQLETKSCPGVEERLRNIETHLGYRPGKATHLAPVVQTLNK